MKLETHQLSIQYDNQIILKDVDFELESKQFALLVGPSGCGKSTLMMALAGLYPKYGGVLSSAVTLDGLAVHSIKANQRAPQIAILFQHPEQQFAMDNVRDEMIFALENLSLAAEEIDKRIDKALQSVGIASLQHRQLSQLSGGELQKVALAETLALGAEIILLDEPFAAVDPIHRQELQLVLKRLVDEGHGILVSDHDKSNYDTLITHLYHMENQQLERVADAAWGDFFKSTQQQNRVDNAPFNQNIFQMQHMGLSNGKQRILENTDLVWPKGKITLITGPNGIGKSSLLRAMAKLQAYSGDLTYQDVSLHRIKLKHHARRVGMVFQNASQQFLNITVAEEIEQAQQHSHRSDYWTAEVIADAVEKLNLIGLSHHSVYELSGGQQKKLQILIMMIIAPETLLMDEPLAGLDEHSIHVLMSLLQYTAALLHQSIIMISHQTHNLLPYIDYHVHFDKNGLHYCQQVAS